jgi:hypothetical protein
MPTWNMLGRKAVHKTLTIHDDKTLLKYALGQG